MAFFASTVAIWLFKTRKYRIRPLQEVRISEIRWEIGEPVINLSNLAVKVSNWPIGYFTDIGYKDRGFESQKTHDTPF